MSFLAGMPPLSPARVPQKHRDPRILREAVDAALACLIDLIAVATGLKALRRPRLRRMTAFDG